MSARPIRPEDGPALVDLAEEFWRESPTYQRRKFDRQKMVALFGRALSSPEDVFCQVVDAPDGTLAGAILAIRVEYIFGPEQMASDLGLFVRREYRQTRVAVKLLKAYEQWARSVGCAEITVGTTAGADGPAYRRLVERLGFQVVGFVAKKPVTES